MWTAIILFWTKKAWPWIKAHPWQTALFPFTILAFIAGILLKGSRSDSVPVFIPPKQNIAESEQKHEQDVEALHQQAQALLSKASQEQVAEYEKLKESGSSAEVAKWIDQF